MDTFPHLTALAATPFDGRRFRDTLAHFPSGITVITGIEDGAPVGFTCQSFYSVSMDPPLVSFSVMLTSTSYPRIRTSGRFAVNVLAQEQHAISSGFARSGADKWADVSWTPTDSGNPTLDGVLMWVDCELWAEHEAGDHYVVIGKVIALGSHEEKEREPLLFFKGQYRALGSPPPAAG